MSDTNQIASPRRLYVFTLKDQRLLNENNSVVCVQVLVKMGQVFGCVRVKQSNVAIKETFGKYDDVLQTKTKVYCNLYFLDNDFVSVVACIQYRAVAADAFYKLTKTRAQLPLYVLDAIRASVPKMDLDSVFEQQNEIAKAVERELGKAMSAYGYELVQTHIVNMKPDEHVKKSMNEINAAEDAESKYLARLGIACRSQAIVDGLRDSRLAFSEDVPGTASKDIMDMVLVTHFDTMKEIGASSKSTSVFIPHGPGAVKDIASQVRDGLLQGNATQS